MRRRGGRGQALIITVLLMLVVVVTVFLTFAIGARTRRKIHLQAVADSTAYSLAVAEARAFNFYAWSNRAIVAHNVSILSVHAHQSYLSFYEDALAATANNFRLMAERSSGPRKRVLNRIADLYLSSDINLEGKHCSWENDPSVPGGRRCRVDRDCTGEQHCDMEFVKGIRGAEFFHNQWHAKDNSNSCHKLLEGSRDHFRKVELLRAYQLGVESQLRVMMTGHFSDMLKDGDEARLDGSTRPGMHEDLRGQIVRTQERSLAQHIAFLTDRRLTAQESAGRVSLQYYERAVDNGMEGNRQKDFDEILAGTRYPDFISQRGFQEDINWRRLQAAAVVRAEGLGRPRTEVTNRGTARMVRMESLAEDPGQATDRPGPLNGVWPPVYRKMPPLQPGESARPAYTLPNVLPEAGRDLSERAHLGGHDQTGFGEGDGIAAEDHGRVDSWFAGMHEFTVIQPGRNSVWGDPHDFRGPSGHDIPGDNTTHSNHIFHGDLGPVPGHGVGLGRCASAACNGEQRGVYRGHMRFKLSSNADTLWNMPRTMTFITRPVENRQPWDFNFEVELPTRVTFTTTQSMGDTWAQGTMAAFAGGLVYFHKPLYNGEEYREPPNFWNPFWRAKLHPVRQADAVTASRNVHPATHNALVELTGWRAMNY